MKILLIDLNWFARFPTLAVGYLSSVLREAGHEVRVLSPLDSGVVGVSREVPPTNWSVWKERITHSTSPWVITARRAWSRAASWRGDLSSNRIRAALDSELALKPQLVLVSAYLAHEALLRMIAARVKENAIPLILGGSFFSHDLVSAFWSTIPGVTAVVGGEVESNLAGMVEAASKGLALSNWPGLWWQGSKPGLPSPSIASIDSIPEPDFGDFRFGPAPTRIIPLLATRGCSHGVCKFCSDIGTSNGRVFRARNPDLVEAEMLAQAKRHDAHHFLFVDLKLNAPGSVWESLPERIQRWDRRVKWAGAVHVDGSGRHALSFDQLERAFRSGLVRLTTGLESGSQALLNRMAKGTELATTERFLSDAAQVGISVRVTLILGYPEETEADLEATAAFLDKHGERIGRVSVNRFHLQMGSRLWEQWEAAGSATRQLAVQRFERGDAYLHQPRRSRGARLAVARILGTAARINRRPLPDHARGFEGAM